MPYFPPVPPSTDPTAMTKVVGGTPGDLVELTSDGDAADAGVAITSLGSVRSVSIVQANGVSGTVANPTTTPALTIALGNITPTSIDSNEIASFNPSLICPQEIISQATESQSQYYAAVGGSDTTGDGSQGNPYATPYFLWQQIFTNSDSPIYQPFGGVCLNIGAGTFNLGSNVLDLSNSGQAEYVGLVGAGVGLTTLVGTITGNGIGVVAVSSNAYIAQLTLSGNNANNQHLLIFSGGEIGVNINTVDFINCTGPIFGLASSPTYINLYQCNFTQNSAGNIVGAAIASGGGVINFFGGSFNLTSTNSGIAIIQDHSGGDGRINIFNATLTGFGHTGCSGISQAGGGKVSTRLFNCVMNTSTTIGTPHDLSFNDTFYQYNSTGSGTSGAFTLTNTVVLGNIFSIGTIAGNIYAPLIAADIVTASQFNAGDGVLLGTLIGSVITDPGIGLSNTVLTLHDGVIALNARSPVDVSSGALLQLDGGNFNMVNGTGTGGSAAVMWLDGATINMGDGTGGTTFPGLALNLDQAQLNFDGLSHIKADGSGDLNFTGAFLSLNFGIITLQGTGSFYVNTNQSIFLNGGTIKFGNGTAALDLNGAGPGGNNNQLPLINANIGQQPVNQSSAVAWLSTSINGQTYWIPVYQ